MRPPIRWIQILPRLIVLALGVIGLMSLVACGADGSPSTGNWDDGGDYEADYGGSGGSDKGGTGGTGGLPATGGAGGAGEWTDDPPEDPVEPPPEENWIQLSTDDSTSMASAQMYKAGFASRALKSHEFVNYYDPPGDLFDAEPWALYEQIGESMELGLTGERIVESCEPPCEDSDVVDLLFELRADRISKVTRRNWNVFLCVDVSGSMYGNKIEFVRDALDRMLIHFKDGDHLTLVTFDSIHHDVFIDLEFGANEAEIREAFAGLQPGSSTNMISGLNRAYELAQAKYDETKLQRVLLFSDGNANVGDTDIDTFAGLTRINGMEGIYLSGVGVGYDYDWDRMDLLTDAGKGAHVFLPSAQEVELIFGDYFHKLVEVAADNIAIEMILPDGIHLESFSGEEVSTNPDARLQNIVLAAGDDMTFVARFIIDDPNAVEEPATLKVTLRPLTTSEEVVVEREVAAFSDLFGEPGQLFERTRIIDAFGKWASSTDAAPPADLQTQLGAYGLLDWGLIEIDTLLAP